MLSDSSRLGALELHRVNPGLLRGYLDARSAPVMANRELGFLSSVFAWGIGRDMVRNKDGRVLLENPCKAVERNKEAPRSRYITDDEYRRLIEYAPIRVQIAMELAYLCRMRRGEVLSAKKSQVLPEGFDTLRTKGSKDTVTQWSPRLRQAVEAALSLPGVGSVCLLHDKRGQPIKDTTLNAAFEKTKRATRLMDLTFHDIKAKGVSDATGSKKGAGGHKSEAMVLVYDRKKLVVPPTR